MPPRRRPERGGAFSTEEARAILRLSELGEGPLRKRTERWSVSRLYATARRAIILRLAVPGLGVPLALKLELPAGIERRDVSTRRYVLHTLAGRLCGLALERTPPAERPRLVRKLDLLPEDLLVDGRLALSGAGFMKSLDLQIIDTLIDGLLDLRAQEVWDRLRAGEPSAYGTEEVYWTLRPTLLMTSYVDVQAALRAVALPEGGSIVDVGAGFGRPGFATALIRPDLAFLGYEIVPERVTEARRVAELHGFSKLDFRVQDLADPGFALPPADAYFFYDPVSGPTRHKLLDDLERVSASRPYVVIAIEGNGALLPDLRARSFLREEPAPKQPMKFTLFRAGPQPTP